MTEVVLKEWESDNLMLDDDLIIDDVIFTSLNEVKKYIIKEDKKKVFLNILWDNSEISDNDYFYLMRWYCDRKTYKEPTPEEIEETRIYFEERDKEIDESYQRTLELLKKK